MRAVDLMNRIAETDCTFALDGERWHGKCLICNGWLSFDRRNGFGANVEHIQPRTLGGDNALLNLGLTHPGCNAEKGRNWDPKRRHRADPDRYCAIVDTLLAKRRERWREGLRTED
jgi:hypothetical protein